MYGYNYTDAAQRGQSGDIAKTVLMPGDPLRAKFIAETYLENPVCFNTVRNMLGYTGHLPGKARFRDGQRVGMPSIGIYSYELYHFYDVETIIRIGSAGGIADHVHVRDVVIGIGACTDSNYGSQFHLPGAFAPIGDFTLAQKAVQYAQEHKIHTVVGMLCLRVPSMGTIPAPFPRGRKWACLPWRWSPRRCI